MNDTNLIWDENLNKDVETPKNIIAFFKAIEELSIKHNLSISHEDCHGAFIIEEYNDDNCDWLFHAHMNIKQKKMDFDEE